MARFFDSNPTVPSYRRYAFSGHARKFSLDDNNQKPHRLKNVSEHILICGLGSIGRRHLRHFRSLGVSRIDAYRTGNATLPDKDQMPPDFVFSELSEALAQQPSAVIIANPTVLHSQTALAAAQAGCHLLIEKPLTDDLQSCSELLHEVRSRKLIASIAQNLRFHPSLMTIRKWVQCGNPLGEVLTARAHCGAYLPDWHPWEDYRNSYAAKTDLGGGAALTNIHEIDYILWMMGPAEDYFSVRMGKQPLQTKVDEATAIVIKHRSGAISTITLSLAQRPPSRTLDLSFTKGTLTLDLLSGKWTAHDVDGKVIAQSCPPEDFTIDCTYRDQAARFLQSVRGDCGPATTLEEGVAAVRIALSAKERTRGESAI